MTVTTNAIEFKPSTIQQDLNISENEQAGANVDDELSCELANNTQNETSSKDEIKKLKKEKRELQQRIASLEQDCSLDKKIKHLY